MYIQVFPIDLEIFIAWSSYSTSSDGGGGDCNVQSSSSQQQQQQYLFDACKTPVGLFMQAKSYASSSSQKQPQKQGQGISSYGSTQANVASQANLKEASVPASSSSSAPERQSLEAIKSLFPDYGDLFLIACLQVFDGSVDRTIDALLSENLPPSLSTMDRTIKKAWLGKGGGGESVAISQGTQGRSNETVYHLTEDKNAKESVREQVRAERRQWEQDMALIAREYDDDYDDQYDEALAYKPSVASTGIVEGNCDIDTSYPLMSNGDKADTTSGASVSKTTASSRPSSQGVSKEEPSHKKLTDARGGSRQESSINIHQQMAEMKRLNQITREDEREVQFWKDMRNDNHKVPVGQTHTQGGDDRSLATPMAKPVSTQSTSKSQRPSDKQPPSSSQRAHTDQAQSHGRTKADALHRKEPSATTSATPFTSAKPREPQQPSAKAVNGATSATNTTDSDTSTPPPTPAPQQPQPQPHKRDNKKFDRHHQRDRAARKMI